MDLQNLIVESFRSDSGDELGIIFRTHDGTRLDPNLVVEALLNVLNEEIDWFENDDSDQFT